MSSTGESNNHECLKKFSLRLKALRIQEKKKIKTICHKTRIVADTLSAYEKGKRYPGINGLIIICEDFKVSANYLLDINQDDFYQKKLQIMECHRVYKKITKPDTFGWRLKMASVDLHISQTALADELSSLTGERIDKGYIILWENNTFKPCLLSFIMVCKILSADPDYILGIDRIND